MTTAQTGATMTRSVMGSKWSTSPYVYMYTLYSQEVNGQPYKTKHRFTCKAQAEKFHELLQDMAARPQDYVSLGGRMTTNSVEGFHGLALMYRDKRTDLGHSHYVCKTNMAICHKVATYII